MRVLTRGDIESLLPHRNDALFLIDAMVNGANLEGTACWPASHPHLAGHFPGFPIVPGVFLIEAAAQLSGVGLASQGNPGAKLGMLAGVKRCLVHQPVRPDEPIRYALELKSGLAGRFYSSSGVAHRVNGGKVLTVEITIAVINRSDVEKEVVHG